MKKITTKEAKSRLKGYIKKYYVEVREDIFDKKSFKRELYGYVVSLSHEAAKMHGWQGHNWRQGLRRHLYSYALNEIDKIERRKRVKRVFLKLFSLGFVK